MSLGNLGEISLLVPKGMMRMMKKGIFLEAADGSELIEMKSVADSA